MRRPDSLARALKRVVGVLGATALLASVAIGSAAPAAANTQPEIHLKPNQTVTITYPPLNGGAGTGAAYNLAFGFRPPGVDADGQPTPGDCEDGSEPTASICDYIPIRIDLSENDLKKGFYALTFTVTWDSENIVIPGTGSFADSGMHMGIWDDPAVEDADAPTVCDPDDPVVNGLLCLVLGPSGGDPGGDEAYYDSFLVEAPLRFGIVPKKNAYAVIIENDYGVAPEYTLSVSLVSPDNLNDLSFEKPVDLSAPVSGGPTTDSLGSGGFGGELSAPGLDLGGLGLADLGLDSDLSALGLTGDENLELEAADIIRGRAIRDIRPPGDENTFFLWLWLVMLPVAAVAAIGLWLLRRRSSMLAGV